MKKSVLILFTLVGICIGFVAYGRCTGTAGEPAVGTVASHAVPSPSSKEHYCFLIDFSIPSGKKRFFVWDFKGDSIKYSSLCAHGYGKESTLKKPVYSNVEGSYCSSLGKYKVGIRSYSKWGINVHYKLHGLEPTNSNAFKRYIVLHSYTPVPASEISPMYLPLGISQGCPVICDEVMRKVDALLKVEKKSVLLWIYE